MTRTFWNGEPCVARRCVAIVADDGRFPEYWARELIGKARRVVEVRQDGHQFYLDDETPCPDTGRGEGWCKVTDGGSPQHGHRSLAVSRIIKYIDPEP